MEILFLLIPLSVVLVLLVGAVFGYALRSGQFDDLDSPGLEVIADQDFSEQPTGQRNVPSMPEARL